MLFVIVLLVYSCRCEEPLDDGLDSIAFRLDEGAMPVFDSDQTKSTLEVTDLRSNEVVEFFFIEAGTGSGDVFVIKDRNYDLEATKNFTCAEYLMKYRTNDADTLKVCYKVAHSKACDGNALDYYSAFLNGSPGEVKRSERIVVVRK